MQAKPLTRSGSSIAAAYDRWSPTYDQDANRTREMAGQVLRQSGLLLAGRRVVEIGCGTGLNTVWLAEGARAVLGLDFSAGMLRRARQRVASPGVHFLEQDISAPWPLATGGADLVVGMLVLEHIADLQPVLREAARALGPNGELWLCELHPMRQIVGRQAVITDPRSGEVEPVDAYLHDVSEHVNTALATGFSLRRLGEHRDPSSRQPELPRLLSLHFARAS